MLRRQYVTAIGTTAILLTGGCVDEDAGDGSASAPDSADNGGSEESPDTDDREEGIVREPPNAQFSADSDESADELTIIHVAGDSIDSERVTIEGGAGDKDWGTETISAGDRVTVSTAGVDSVTVVWTSESGATAELFTVDVSG
jgi:hypothetical protein